MRKLAKEPKKDPSPVVRPWPSCCSCDGPALPKGEPSFRVKFEVDTYSEANGRNRWAEINRKKDQRERTIEEVSVALAEGQVVPTEGPWYVRITRIAPEARSLDRSDNLPRALKAIQDVIAEIVGIDDASEAIAFRHKQRSEDRYLGVEIEIWGGSFAP